MNIENKSLGDIVATYPATKLVFDKAGIDYCCGGERLLEETYKESAIEPEQLLKDLIQASERTTTEPNWMKASYRELIRHIVATHHRFIEDTIDETVDLTGKIYRVHGNHHPELREVFSTVSNLRNELKMHMIDEETAEFPAIEDYEETRSKAALEKAQSLVQKLRDDHDAAGDALRKIRELTNNYELPEDACPTYYKTLDMLRKLEDDMHTHVHLENNILFKRIMAESA